MTFHHRPHVVKAAAAHLLESAGYRTKSDGDPMEILARKFGDHAAEVMRKLGASNAELEGLKANMDELSQKMARRGATGGSADDPETMGKQFIDNVELKSFADYRTRPSRFSMNVKATLTTAIGSAGAIAGPRVVTTPGQEGTVNTLEPLPTTVPSAR